MSGSLFAKTTSQIAYSATTTLLSRLPPQLGTSSSPSPVVSHLSRPEAGPISVRAHEVWYNRDSSLTTQRSVDSAIHERVVAQQELEHQNFRGSRQRRRVLNFRVPFFGQRPAGCAEQ